MRVYVDTSALLALYQRHTKTDEVEAWCREAKIIISRLALVEFRSAILKFTRRREITLKQARELIGAFRKDLSRYLIRELSPDTWRVAGDLVERYSPERDFRSLDAIQLATAKTLPRSSMVTHFITLDTHPLADVARQEGFSVKP